MEGVNIVYQNRRKQGIALWCLRDAPVKQRERLAKKKKKKDGINGKEVCLIIYLKKRCLFKIFNDPESIRDKVIERGLAPCVPSTPLGKLGDCAASD